MTQVLSTGGVPGLRDGEWEEMWDCWGGGVLNGEFEGEEFSFFRNNIDDKFHKIFVIHGEFEGKNQFS